jgi:hypothetical protein
MEGLNIPVKRIFWWLPRPSESKYPGSFPRNFERMVCNLLGLDPDRHKILQPFGGSTTFGDTVDLPSQKDFLDEFGIKPTFWGNAEDLHWIKDDTYDFTLCDPPYSKREYIEIYGITRKFKRTKWIDEAVRVTKVHGFIGLYHRLLLPRPKGCQMKFLIALATRANHEGRLCPIYQKKAEGEINIPEPKIKKASEIFR